MADGVLYSAEVHLGIFRAIFEVRDPAIDSITLEDCLVGLTLVNEPLFADLLQDARIVEQFQSMLLGRQYKKARLNVMYLQQPTYSQSVTDMLEEAEQIVLSSNGLFVGIEHLLLATLLQTDTAACEVLDAYGITRPKLLRSIDKRFAKASVGQSTVLIPA